MAFPLEVTFQSTGAPFIQAPDGTKEPDIAGDPVDLTGVPLTVAPEANGPQAGRHASIDNQVGATMTVSGLENMGASSVGRNLTLSGADNDGNDGTFPIVAVLSPTTVNVVNAGGAFPDANSGIILWSEDTRGTDFPPGDPLTAVAEQVLPLYYNQQTFGPAEPAESALQVPNEDVSDPALQTQFTGKNRPKVAATGPRTGPNVYTDPQQPVRTAPNSSFLVNQDPDSPAYGLEPILGDGPAVRTPAPFVAEPDPAVSSAPAGGAVLYPTANPIVFSRS